MRFVGEYKEMNPSKDLDSITKHFAKSRYPMQDVIVRFLKNGESFCASTALPHDVITGERINMECVGKKDGDYVWVSTLAYYVDKYNLELPDDFVKYILLKQGK